MDRKILEVRRGVAEGVLGQAGVSTWNPGGQEKGFTALGTELRTWVRTWVRHALPFGAL